MTVDRSPGAGGSRARALRWVVLGLAVLGLSALYARPLATPFLNDDYLFLEETSRRPLAESIASLGPLGNYFRPVSRQLYFETLAPLADGRPLVFHLVNFAIFLLALALLADLLRGFLRLPGVCAGLLYFATIPFQRVNLTWISCSQDLLALTFSLGAVALFRRGKDLGAALLYLLAVFSKESALPLPLALALWPGATRASWPRLRPFLAVLGIWVTVTIWIRARTPVAAPLHLGPDGFLAALAHGAQSLLGLEQPSGLWPALLRHGPAPLAAIFLAGVMLLLPARPAVPVEPTKEPPPGAVRFGLLWIVAHALVVGPVVSTWSAYHYTLAAVGAALLFGLALRRVGPTGWLLLVGALLWWHAAGSGARTFAVGDRIWGWTTHLSSFYFERAASLTDTLGAQLRRLEPKPPPSTRLFFATLPPWAGFQMGNGAQIRHLYRDPSLESHFYSQFSESTAAWHPVRFYHWNGAALAPLHPPGGQTFFQVGSDLLAFDRFAGARHAFRRGLDQGEDPIDHWYWLGWTELWLGRRAEAERAWISFGARDDSLEWWMEMRRARQALIDQGDTLEAKRRLAGAIRLGIGRPEAHAVLGQLLLRDHPKYGLLELKIAATLKPDDWLARRDLLVGLIGLRLHDEAWAELARLKRIKLDWMDDATVLAAIDTLERHRGSRDVVRF